MKKLLLSVAASAMLATGAMAADLAATPATYDSAAFDWDGFYVGLGVTGSVLSNGIITDTTGYIDLIAGFNATSGDMLFGLEGWVGGYSFNSGAPGFGGGLEARVGYLVSPDALVYLAGGGYFYDAGGQYGTIGGGVEFAVTDDLSLDLEYKYWAVSNTGFTGHSLGASANWHF